MRISLQTLCDHGACVDQVEAFETFLNGRSYVLVTDRNVRLAAKAGLDVFWALRKGLIPPLNGMVEWPNGNKAWYLNGKVHREGEPAMEYCSGYKEWYFDGKLHRTDGPAVEWINGSREWWVNGVRHRKDGPAIEWANGLKWWYLKGKLHRVDGPAVEGANGHKGWYLNGEFLRREDR